MGGGGGGGGGGIVWMNVRYIVHAADFRVDSGCWCGS